MKKAAPDLVQQFEALLEAGSHYLGWTTARIPFNPHQTWSEMIRLRVAGRINGFPFRNSLFSGEESSFYLLVNRAMQQGAGATAGHRAAFALWPDLEPRPAELPDELASLLDDEPGLRGWYDGLPEYTRREAGKWIAVAKSEQARAGRAMQMAERLLATMEAERELPPLIATALRRRPGAMEGWHKLTVAQRRGQLLAVFYYQTPEARGRRVAKLCDLAASKAGAQARD